MLNSVRARLTLWYAGVLALALLSFGALTYYGATRSFHARQDDSLCSTAETVASAYMQEFEEEGSIEKANEVVLAQMVFPDRYVEIADAAGRPVAVSDNLTAHVLPITTEQLAEARARGVSYNVAGGINKDADAARAGLRVAVVPLTRASDASAGFALVAESLAKTNEDLARLRHNFYAGVPLIILFASLGGYFLARKSLAPIALMNQQTQRITAENLSARLDVLHPHDELGELARTINELLARLDTAFNEQQRFVADASHELRTPVAVIRSETEVALEHERSVADYKDALALIKDEAERLTRIVEDLFMLLREPVGARAEMSERFYLNDLIAECARSAAVLAARKSITLKVGALPELTLTGDEEALKRMLLNLLDNAVKYTPTGGRINVALTTQTDAAQIIVTDTGIGIPFADQVHVFDRFYRVDKARTRAQGGAGLGDRKCR